MYIMTFIVIANIVMLFAAAFVGFPSYTYYYVLRGLTCFSSLMGAFVAHAMPLRKQLIYVYIAMAVLFNPFVLIRLSRSTWQLVDIIAGLLLIYVSYSVAKDSKVSLSLKTSFIIVGMVAAALFLIANGRGVGIAFKSMLYVIAALLMSFFTFASGSLLFGHISAHKKETGSIVMALILTGICAVIAFTSWETVFKTLGFI